jgi:xylulokinase
MTRTDLTIGVDIGTSSTKGVLVDLSGRVLHTVVINHEVQRPRPGQVEMDGLIWWQEFVEITRELVEYASEPILSVGVSGMGPCVLLTDDVGRPVRPAILYGIDSRAGKQIDDLNAALGAAAIFSRCGSELSSQAVGPKLAWVAENEPENWDRARHLFMPASWLAWKLTGEYVLDHHSASQCTPLYDTTALDWHHPWADPLLGQIELPRLGWPGEVAGVISDDAAVQTGLSAGTPVIVGTIDAWSEAISVGAGGAGDLMLMYGTTMFLINTSSERVVTRGLWGTVGAFPQTWNFAAGMATSGAITAWLRTLFGSPDYPTLLAEAAQSPPGSRGLLMLPYFAGERTPIADPDARGLIAGLTVEHSRGDLYRAALEATAFGVRHNIEKMREAGATINRIVAAGGGTQGALWPQIVSDVTGLLQELPEVTIGASFGAAYLAAQAIPEAADASISQWNPPAREIVPNRENSARYDAIYADYLQLYPVTREISHRRAGLHQHDI